MTAVVVGFMAAVVCGQEIPPPPAGPDTSATPPPPAGPGESNGEMPPPPTGPEGEVPSPPVGPDGEQAPPPPPGPAEADEPARAKDTAVDVVDWLGLSGFWEARGGVRTQEDPDQRQASIGETRLQVDLERPVGELVLRVTADFHYDAVPDGHAVDLERGEGWLDLRQANLTFSPAEFMDVKVGRQILTWGTGDLLFVNDLFPKDWRSFFIGRDVDYLKAPSDAMKTSVYTDPVNLDFVYVPRFDADRFIDGERISFYSDLAGGRVGRDRRVHAQRPDDWFRDDEFHARLWRNVSGYELAAYGYWGYWKSPGGMDPTLFQPTFPRLNVYGGSARGQLAGGIANFEAAFYDSRDDRDGDDPFVNNSQVRILVGYERDLPQVARDLSVGVQYYLELKMDYGEYRRALPPGVPPDDEGRQLATFRVTKLLMNQNLTLSLFAYYSPTDSDAYVRPRISYKVSDHWTVEAGGNVFFGARAHTFFNQFARNSNVYAAARYSF